MLSNGNGSLDWTGLPLVVDYFGITDIDALLNRLSVIKFHKKPDLSKE